MVQSTTTSASTTSQMIVIKLGTSSILSSTTSHPKLSLLSSIVELCHTLRSRGHKVIIVCSGAIGLARLRMKVENKPKNLGERQALAAIGQLKLMALWESLFGNYGIEIAQVLLTRNDIADRPRYLNARTTLQTLLQTYNAIPIVNENDTVSVSELRFGDNDTLSAITAGLIDADWLFLCTDVDGLYTGNPTSDPNAKRLEVVRDLKGVRDLVNLSTEGSSFGTGGMQTKLIAAELATAAGVSTVILNSDTPTNILKIVDYGLPTMIPNSSTSTNSNANKDSDSIRNSELFSSSTSTPSERTKALPSHTIFLPFTSPTSRKWTILHALHPAGVLLIDQGAWKRISRSDSGGRLLPVGVKGVVGNWERMQCVRLVVKKRKFRNLEKENEKIKENEEGKGNEVKDQDFEKSLNSVIDSNNSINNTGNGNGKDDEDESKDWEKKLETYLHSSIASISSLGLMSSSGGNTTPNKENSKMGSGSGNNSLSNSFIDENSSKNQNEAIDSEELSKSLNSGLIDEIESSTTILKKSEEAEEEFDENLWELVEIGRALANYTSIECERIRGVNSSQISTVLGYADSDYVTDQVALSLSWTEENSKS